MNNKFRRWYEKSECLKAFMNLLQDVDIDTQCEIAVDMIIKSSSLIDRDYSKIIEEVSSFDQRDFHRWYDINPNVHVAIESLKDLEDEQRDNIIQEFVDKILNNHPESIEGVK